MELVDKELGQNKIVLAFAEDKITTKNGSSFREKMGFCKTQVFFIFYFKSVLFSCLFSHFPRFCKTYNAMQSRAAVELCVLKRDWVVFSSFFVFQFITLKMIIIMESGRAVLLHQSTF